MVYTLTVFFVLIITLMHDNMKRGKKELAFIAFFTLFLLAAIRYRIGADHTMIFVQVFQDCELTFLLSC